VFREDASRASQPDDHGGGEFSDMAESEAKEGELIT
jgi:hypothetical protein